MGMKIDELIAFCKEEEHSHRVRCKRADDASGYTRSKDKNIRTACAIREDTYADFYKEIADTMHKYQKIEQIVEDRYGKPIFKFMDAIVKVVEDGKHFKNSVNYT